MRLFLLILCLMPIFSCAGRRPANLGVTPSGLAPCPSSPNCVSSEATDAAHHVAPFALAVSAPDGWQAARVAIAALPRTRIVTATSDYLHAECSSAVFGFVDDLEVHLRPAQGVIAVRSASRIGYGDLGVNRRRVERIRSVLAQSGIVR
jgi:uncharacterized protein (DUF1499 family)